MIPRTKSGATDLVVVWVPGAKVSRLPQVNMVSCHRTVSSLNMDNNHNSDSSHNMGNSHSMGSNPKGVNQDTDVPLHPLKVVTEALNQVMEVRLILNSKVDMSLLPRLGTRQGLSAILWTVLLWSIDEVLEVRHSWS